MPWSEYAKFTNLDLGRGDLEGQMQELTKKANKRKATLVVINPGPNAEYVAFHPHQIQRKLPPKG